MPDTPANPGQRLLDPIERSAEILFGLIMVLTFAGSFRVTGADPRLALRVSNLAALIMLFLTGWSYGKYASYRPWHVGFWMVVIGLCMVVLTIALGG